MPFSCEDRDDATRTFMARTSVEARMPLSKYTMPLFAEDGGQGWLCATSVLLRISGKHFLLTAAHVFDNWKDTPIPLNITDGVVGNRLLPIGEVTLRRSPTAHPQERLIDDPYDVCVCDLSDETAMTITAGKHFEFLELKQVAPWEKLDPRSWYTVFGFPGELNDGAVAPQMLGSNASAYATFPYLGERGVESLKDSVAGVSVLMDYGPNTTEDDSGRLVTPPHPGGMSGGGIWRLAEYGSEIDKWDVDEVKLIGIQSAVYEDEQVLRGTRVEHCLGFIYRGHEDLREAFEGAFGAEWCRSNW